MKKILIALTLTLITLVLAAPVLAVTPDSARLIVGRDASVDTGSLNLELVDDTLTVIFTMDGDSGWLLDETHLYVGDVPPEKSAPGKFPYKDDELGGVVTHSYEISEISSIDENGDNEIYVAAHAALIMEEVDPETGETLYSHESSWAQVGSEDNDLSFGKGKNWASCFIVDLSE